MTRDTPSAVIARLGRAIQYSRDAAGQSRSRGVLDHPPSRVMTKEYVARYCHAAVFRGLRFATAPQDDGYGQGRCSDLPRKLIRAELACDLVEHGVDHAGLVLFDEGVRDIDVFGNDDAAGHVLAVFQFVG